MIDGRWDLVDIVLKFVELWASYQKFPSYSRLQCLGSTILRAVERYHDAERLSASTGWSFLQEVGWIPAWEIPARTILNLALERGPYIDQSQGVSVYLTRRTVDELVCCYAAGTFRY